MSIPTSTTIFGQIVIDEQAYDLRTQPLGDEQKENQRF